MKIRVAHSSPAVGNRVREVARKEESTGSMIEERGRYKIMISPIPGGPVLELRRTLERIHGALDEGAAGDPG